MTRDLYDLTCPACGQGATDPVLEINHALINQFVEYGETGRRFINLNLARPPFQFVDLNEHDNNLSATRAGRQYRDLSETVKGFHPDLNPSPFY